MIGAARGGLLAGWWTILVLELVQLQSLLGFAACLCVVAAEA
jgi:hypothetical protein